ncbi:hypothetical protein P152DRAFT_194990 [Eremomyces bilateralis CBS 781.70]|uniref:BZIP domain-containing protein n=1 Tax=Eremomyces bilateralis CBS 781.70 TaxID=1392243 RepID=A0A6G1GCH6_9PEZI|nr:uncharacterized protein P152DRAFT_194990 [Eremomyces bilateralis CBS 781.70]KAF1815734.1 hypothetical protein P152DRAFT_194990 [Eremomyces bilateralis CBS 781.70]
MPAELGKRGGMTVDERRERKRALDRDAQRNLREKTRNRIASLEALVQTLQDEKCGDKRIRELVAQLHEAQDEIQNLRDTLSSIEKLLTKSRSFNHQDDLEFESTPHGMEEMEKKPVSVADSPAMLRPNLSVGTGTESRVNLDYLDMSTLLSKPQQSPDQVDRPFEGLSTSQVPNTFQLEPFGDFGRKTALYHQEVPDPLDVDHRCGFLSEVAQAVDLDPTSDQIPLHTSSSVNLSDPIAQITNTILRKQIDGKLWYLANDCLQYILTRPTYALCSVDTDEDITIRAFLEGWSAVEQKYTLDGCWKWLKALDCHLFSHLGFADRASIIHGIRRSFSSRVKRVRKDDDTTPPFTHPSLAQLHIQHDPIVDFFVWPGLREQMIFNRTRFACDRFVSAFCTNYLFLWSHDLRDIYHHDPATGLYAFSSPWHAHVMDLHCFQMRPGFFELFPELRSEMSCSVSQCLVSRELRPHCCGEDGKGGSREQKGIE